MSSCAISQSFRFSWSVVLARHRSIRSARFVILLCALKWGDTVVTGAWGDARGGGAIYPGPDCGQGALERPSPPEREAAGPALRAQPFERARWMLRSVFAVAVDVEACARSTGGRLRTTGGLAPSWSEAAGTTIGPALRQVWDSDPGATAVSVPRTNRSTCRWR